MSKLEGTRKSYGIKESYISPLNQRIIAVMKALENFTSAYEIVDALNKELILLTSLTTDLQTAFEKDIKKIMQLLFDEPQKATGATQALRTEHATQTLFMQALKHRRYAVELWMRITLALDKKGWLDKVMRDIPSNF